MTANITKTSPIISSTNASPKLKMEAVLSDAISKQYKPINARIIPNTIILNLPIVLVLSTRSVQIIVQVKKSSLASMFLYLKQAMSATQSQKPLKRES